MQSSERNFALEIAKGALAVISLPFSLLRTSVRSISQRGEAAKRARFDTTNWTFDLLRHLEWRRFEELCTAYFESLGFTTKVTRSRADGAADIALRIEGAENVSVLVHCKAWSAYPIGLKPLQELFA